MKTIYTDRFFLYPVSMLLLSAYHFWLADEGFQQSDGNQLGLNLGIGSLFLILTLARIFMIWQAHKDGRDLTIVRIRDK